MKTLLTVLGTRPEIVKFSPLLPLFDERFRHVLVHTGQHYDENMDRVFFRELELKEPDHFLNVGMADAGAGVQTGRMLERIEPIVKSVKPDWVAVLGDTNSTLAGALVASKLNVPVAHVEAGCRSFNRRMPEEQNRVLVDHLSDLLFAPDQEAVAHLKREGIGGARVHLVGNTGLDATARTMGIAGAERLDAFGVRPDAYALVTLHRAENTNDVPRFARLIAALNSIAERVPVLFPIHPRTRLVLERQGIALAPAVRALEPLGNLDFIALLRNTLFVLSDSGGIQEEAAVVNRPCLILREDTEWTRLVDSGKNFLVGTQTDAIVNMATQLLDSPRLRQEIAAKEAPLPFGATDKIVTILQSSSGAAS
jgi:UDP-N-acetylglucosamine 2-epimerase (non-hydrolysing)